MTADDREDLKPPLTKDDDRLLDELERAIDHILAVDLVAMPKEVRRVLTGHLTGAVYVTLRNAQRVSPHTSGPPGSSESEPTRT